MTDAMQKRLFGLAAVLVAVAGVTWFLMADLSENLVYYWTPSELAAAANAEDATVRLGGMVVPGSMKHDPERSHLSFEVTDGETQVLVESEGNPPQMFREGIGVVVEGKIGADGVFYSDKVMVKHSNEYQAPEGEGDIDMAKMKAAIEGAE